MVFYDGFDGVFDVADVVGDLVYEVEYGVGELFVVAGVVVGEVSEDVGDGFDCVRCYEGGVLVVVGEFDGVAVVVVVEAGWYGDVELAVGESELGLGGVGAVVVACEGGGCDQN